MSARNFSRTIERLPSWSYVEAVRSSAFEGPPSKLCTDVASQICCLQGDKVTLKVNKLTSTKTQLPYDYYSIWFCRPEHIVSSAENLGEVLRGDRIENSPYEVIAFLFAEHTAYAM